MREIFIFALHYGQEDVIGKSIVQVIKFSQRQKNLLQ